MPANDGQKPTQIFTPRNTILLIISLIVIMLLSSFIGYTIAQKTNTKSITTETSLDNKMMSDTAKSSTLNTSSNPALVAPKDTTPTIAPVATTQPEVWTGEITLKPKNAEKFDYSVSTKIYESSTVGKAKVDLKKSASDLTKFNMYIVNKNLKYYDNGKMFDDVKNFINNGENFKNENGLGYLDAQTVNIDNFGKPQTPEYGKYFNGVTKTFLFTTNSEVYGLSPKISPIKEIEYKGTDKAIVLATTGGLNILAIKGDNLIQLSSYYYKSDGPISFDGTLGYCEAKKLGQSVEAEKCGAIGIINSTNKEKIINDTAQELLATFAL